MGCLGGINRFMKNIPGDKRGEEKGERGRKRKSGRERERGRANEGERRRKERERERERKGGAVCLSFVPSPSPLLAHPFPSSPLLAPLFPSPVLSSLLSLLRLPLSLDDSCVDPSTVEEWSLPGDEGDPLPGEVRI